MTTPAPLVQRLPTPPASETTATTPFGQRLHAERQRCRGASSSSGARIFDPAGDRQAILREADAAGAQVGLDLLVLHAIEPVGFEQRFQASATRPVSCSCARGSR